MDMTGFFWWGTPPVPVAYEEITIDAVGETLTQANVNICHFVEVKFENGPMRIRMDGTAPTPSVGIPVYDLDKLYFNVPSAKLLQMIRNGTTNGIAHCTYWTIK